jgi:adenylate cyclase
MERVATAPRGASIRVAVWVLHLALPLLGLWLLLSNPPIDIEWQHHPTHFWLVASVALINVLLGFQMSGAAAHREDARLFLVSLVFLSSAGFLFLHSLATPGVLLSEPNVGFSVATPIGLALASIFAVVSSLNFTPYGTWTIMRYRRLIRAGLVAIMVAWAALSIFEVQPLSAPPNEEELHGVLIWLAAGCVALFLVAAYRYYRVYRKRPSVMLIAVITAFSLLAESMIVVAQARGWHISWWEWHFLLVAAFGFVAYSARIQYKREGSSAGLFNGIAADQTVNELRAEYGAALDALAGAIRGQEERGWTEEEIALIAQGLSKKFGLTEGQTAVLAQGAEALATERDQLRRLDALVAVGRESKVIVSEDHLLQRAIALIAAGFGHDAVRIGLLTEGQLRFPFELTNRAQWPAPDSPERHRALNESLRSLEPVDLGASGLVLPLTAKGRAAGVLEVHRPNMALKERDRSLLQALASQLSIALENARLYGQMEGLFRTYMSPDVATALIADPRQAALGGALVEVTVLFADLRGYTPFTERNDPAEVVEMINSYFGVSVPRILESGGTVLQFVGDAILALFNAPVRLPDHPLQAARAALAMQAGIEQMSLEHSDWPRFRIGINTGRAVVGNVGSKELRGYGATGDTINTAARLQTIAEPGEVVIGHATYEAIRDFAKVRPLGRLEVKGKSELVEAFVLEGLEQTIRLDQDAEITEKPV